MAFAISTQGEVYIWGNLSNKPEEDSYNLVKSLNFLESDPRTFGGLKSIKISSLSCNNAVAIFLSEDGTLYSEGNDLLNKFGILGVGEIYSLTSPSPISTLFDHRIKLISVGYSHACALNSVGYLFTWGTGKRGQLGHKGIEKMAMPKLVESAKVFNGKQAICSYNVTALLTGGGFVFVYGVLKNSSSFLSQNMDLIEGLEGGAGAYFCCDPQPIEQLQEDFITKISAGEGFLTCLSSTVSEFMVEIF